MQPLTEEYLKKAPDRIIGYLIPEFPGQTHIWMWRELRHLREWGVAVRIFSTRPPSERDQARHDFATSARRETTYLACSVWRVLRAMSWAALTRGRSLLSCVQTLRALPLHDRSLHRRVEMLAGACVLSWELRAQGIAHLHVHSCAKSAVLAMLAQRLVGIPYSMTLNANIEWWGGAMFEKFAEAEFTIAITRWLFEQMRRDYPALRDEQVVFGRIGVDTRKWKPSPRPSASGGQLRVMTIGRLHATKGHDVLLRAVAECVSSGVDITLRIAGAGPEEQPLRTLVSELQLEERVQFLGSVSEDRLITELQATDVFVLASHGEPLGVVYMEAMAMEAATVGTAAGGVAEIITDGLNGRLFPPGDVASLARILRQLVDNPEERQRMGTEARATIVRHFDSRHGAATLYERIFGHRPPDYQAFLAIVAAEGAATTGEPQSKCGTPGRPNDAMQEFIH